MEKTSYAKVIGGQGTEDSVDGDDDGSNAYTISPLAHNNISNPFYLHNSDNPGPILVTHQLSVGGPCYKLSHMEQINNYGAWCQEQNWCCIWVHF